ncbi:hypothetical protein ACJW30_10G147000 [Castanea mollissima]
MFITSKCWLKKRCALIAIESSHTMASKKKNKDMQRFNDEQIKLLETMFKEESRPESRKKQKLANELGLHPRQVATWFQNRRARLKTKQIEREYSLLKASYGTLASNFESLKRDNQLLLLQLQKLKNMLDKQHGKNGMSSDSNSVKGDSTSESKEKPSVLSESVNHNINMFIGDANCEDAECTDEETGTLNIAEPIDDSLTSSEDEDWCSFLDQSSGNSQW